MSNAQDAERVIRSAALALAEALAAGRAAGLSVAWPSRVEDLPAISISATSKAAETWPIALLDEGPGETSPAADPETPALTKAKRTKAS